MRHAGFKRRAGLSGGIGPPLQKSQQAGSPFAGQAKGSSSLCAIRAVRSRTKNRDVQPRPCLADLMFVPYGATAA